MVNSSIDANNLKNMDNLINTIVLNHKNSECNRKWAVCYALAVLEPSKIPGSNSEDKEILLNWCITEHWWCLATHFALGKVII